MPLSPSPFSVFILINSNASRRLSQTLMDNKEISKTPPQSENSSKNQTLVALQPDNFQENVEKRSLKLSTIRNNSHHHGRRFLGVRQRPSGRWVAEIKDSSLKLRLWLGTFDKPEDAAMAYDNAARILRGRNAKTNFRHPHGIMNFYEQNLSLLGKNPRIYQVLQHVITKSSPLNQKMGNNRDEFINIDKFVEETIFCSSSSSSSSSSSCSSSLDCSHGYGLSFGSSKVYSSVVVAPSFSSEGREDGNTN